MGDLVAKHNLDPELVRSRRTEVWERDYTEDSYAGSLAYKEFENETFKKITLVLKNK